mgnify:CR=1 FL=1
MKKKLLFIALVASSMANAQSLTQANEPAIGESASMFLVDSFATNYAGVTGTNVTWDYSNLAGYENETRMIQVVDPATTADAASFPTSTKAYDLAGTIVTYYTSTSGERSSQGFRFTEPTMGDVVSQYDTDELIMVTYPFANGSSLTDAYSGSVSYNIGLPTTESLSGNAYAWIDGQGTLELPLGVTLTDVIRYKSIDTAYSTAPIIGAVEIIREQYEYYIHSIQNLPVFIHASIKIQQPAAAPLGEVSLVLSYYETEEYVGLEEEDKAQFSVYPNPANDVITIKGDLTNSTSASVIDQSGRVLKTFNPSINNTVNIADLNSGMYILSIESKGTIQTVQIIKK